MKIALYGKNFSPDFRENINEMFVNFARYSADIYIHNKFLKILNNSGLDEFHFNDTFTTEKGLPEGIEVLISMGGDGTFLETLQLAVEKKVPVLGVNTGRLGFLANISREELKEAIQQLLTYNFSTETRNLIRLDTDKETLSDFSLALNEVTIHKKGLSMISIHAYLDGEFLNSYWADGLIISTPTGSTAYSMAVGGPIMLPMSRNFIISPISPHNLTVRPIVVPDNMEIRLRVSSRSNQFMVALDSRSNMVSTDRELIVSKASQGINMVKLHGTSFYNTLRNKLMWGMDKRN